jgi:hypothetical protein
MAVPISEFISEFDSSSKRMKFDSDSDSILEVEPEQHDGLSYPERFVSTSPTESTVSSSSLSPCSLTELKGAIDRMEKKLNDLVRIITENSRSPPKPVTPIGSPQRASPIYIAGQIDCSGMDYPDLY